MLEDIRPEHPSFTADQGRGAVDASDAFDDLVLHEDVHPYVTSRAKIVDFVASTSYVGGLPEPERRDVLERVDALLARHGVTEVTASLKTMMWIARRR